MQIEAKRTEAAHRRNDFLRFIIGILSGNAECAASGRVVWLASAIGASFQAIKEIEPVWMFKTW
jgi:hypothetical protein